MNYKILEAIGIENENVDGAAFNNFSAGGKSGVIQGVLNECNITFVANTLTIDKGLLLINGVRIKIVEPYDFSLTGIPAVATNYEIIARVQMLADRTVSFEFILRTPQPLVKDSFFKTESGVYELEIAEFIHGTDGSIKNVQRKYEILSGSSSGGTGSSVEVVQSTGTSKTAVMSQDATTKELEKRLKTSGGTLQGETLLKIGQPDITGAMLKALLPDGTKRNMLYAYLNADGTLAYILGAEARLEIQTNGTRPILRNVGNGWEEVAVRSDITQAVGDINTALESILGV